MVNCNCGNGSAPHKVWCAIRAGQRERRVTQAVRPEKKMTKAQKRLADHDRHVKAWREVVERVRNNLDSNAEKS